MSRIAVITGAGSGIGRAVAQSLARKGWWLVLAGRRAEAIAETADLCEADEAPPLCLATDVSDPASVDALFDQAVAHFGRVDLLFNNAGIGTLGIAMDELSPADWAKVVETNLSGTFFCMSAAFRVMKAQMPQGGRIINNGSVSAHSPRPFSAAYTASKHGVTGLTKSGALDGRPFNIAVGQIDIGNAQSPMAERMHHGMPQADGRIMPEPVMDVAHVGNAVAHMADLPLDANIPFMTIMPTSMPLIGRG
jgi:NAD(P)-dependent dehydrogenase (short-subunit alcohol dehydrogenase family)